MVKLPGSDRLAGAVERVRALPSRWVWLRVVLDVKDRFSELHGGYVASAVTLTTFLSLFPLILVATAVAGFLSAGGTDVAEEIVSGFGLTGEAARVVNDAVDKAEESRRAASAVGLLGLLWSGLGVVAALEYAYDTVWQVTGRGLRDKLYGLAWLAGAGLLFVASFGLTAALNVLPGFLAPLNTVVAMGVSTALFLWAAKALCNRDVGWRPLLPGAVVGAVGLELLKAAGSIVIPRLVASSSGLYGSIGTVFAILAWLLFFGRLVVLTAVLNVVLWEREHGTATVELEVPRQPGQEPGGATRAGETEAEPEDQDVTAPASSG
jgi:membrane protein